MVTSVYFARRNAWKNLKLRLREYSEVQEPSSELVTEPPPLPPPKPWLWRELKQREGSTTSKRRIRISRATAASRFVSSRAAQALSHEQEPAQREVEELLLHLKEADEPLAPNVEGSKSFRARWESWGFASSAPE